MQIEDMLDDEIRPTCPKCGGEDFAAVSNAYVARTTQSIPMIICADLNCRAVVGVLPFKDVFPEHL
jgi:predicted  nucleic acid-binding Zn-ribbon protein